jgi:ParB family chromosome partitioning protein
MDMFEEARAMSGTMELCHITQKELADRMGVSQSYVANKLRLLALSPHVERLIKKHGVSERHARALLRLESDDDRLEVLEKVIARELTVRECEALVDIKCDIHMPRVIEEADSHLRVDTFLDTLKKSLVTLRSFGIDVTDRTSYHGDKMYVTVCFSNI